MKVVSLFSGCGGMDFGIENVGGEVIFANDIMPQACETYRRHFSQTEFVEGDIREISNFPNADLVVGGYPCQSFSMGGNRNPASDPRTFLFSEFARAVDQINPRFFIAENVSGLKSVQNGRWLDLQTSTFELAGKHGYELSTQVVQAQDFGVPQRRKRVFVVGVRRDLGMKYVFPTPTHGKLHEIRKTGLIPYASHGEAIKDLPIWPEGEFYERPHDPEGHFSWYYMSRNRKAPWVGPSYTIVANFRHITLHPASAKMELLWSNLADGWKQKWIFSEEYEHLQEDPTLPILEVPRRLSWREAARIQTFPEHFDPSGNLMKKFEQIGNAVPPKLIEAIVRPIIDGTGLIEKTALEEVQTQLQFL